MILVHRALANDTPASVVSWLIAPLSLDVFFDEHWETRPLVIRRADRDYYRGLFSKDSIDGLLRTRNLQYSTNIDVVRYDTSAGRVTMNKEGTAKVKEVWQSYEARIESPESHRDGRGARLGSTPLSAGWLLAPSAAPAAVVRPRPRAIGGHGALLWLRSRLQRVLDAARRPRLRSALCALTALGGGRARPLD